MTQALPLPGAWEVSPTFITTRDRVSGSVK
jgi:hypothetical protein